MNKKRFWLFCGFLGVMAISLFLLIQGTASARGRMIYIHGSWEGTETDTAVEPETTRADRNTTIIWINESKVEVKINFPEGKMCKQVTTAAPDWSMAGTCWITKDSIPPGGTTSVFFNTNGKFEYEVEFVGKNRKEKGIIIIGPKSSPGAP